MNNSKRIMRKSVALLLAFLLVLGLVPGFNNQTSLAEDGLTEATAINKDGKITIENKSYNGKALIKKEGNLSNESTNQNVPVKGLKIYLQWMNDKGFVSPIYYTTSRQDGTYSFDLSQDEIDATGTVHPFKLSGDGNFLIRTWVDKNSYDSTKYTLVKNGDFYSGYFHNRLTRKNESWNFTVGIENVSGAQIVLQERHENELDWLAKPRDQWQYAIDSNQQRLDTGIWPKKGNFGTYRGSVWYENRENPGALANQYFKENADIYAVGKKVAVSYVNDEVARRFDTWRKANKTATLDDFKNQQKEIVKQYEQETGIKGSAIAETVVGTVEADGSYYIPFRGLYGVSRDKKGSRVTEEQYGQLVSWEDDRHDNLMQWNGTLGQLNRHINVEYMYAFPVDSEGYNYWSPAFPMAMFKEPVYGTSGDLVADVNASANIFQQKFVLLAANPSHNVIEYDTKLNYAIPKNTANTKTVGLISSTNYKITWFKDGQQIGEVKKVLSSDDGTLESFPITVPQDLDKSSVYTSAVFLETSTGKALEDAILVDSFIAVVMDVYSYEPAEVKPGEEKINNAPTGDNTSTTEVEKKPVSQGATFAIKEGYQIPEGYEISVNPTTGEVTVKVPDDAFPGKEIDVPVTMTVPADGLQGSSTQDLVAKFTVVNGDVFETDPNDPQTPEGYVLVVFDPTEDGKLDPNPKVELGTKKAYNVKDTLTWEEAVQKGLVVPTPEYKDESKVFAEKWTPALPENGAKVVGQTYVAQYLDKVVGPVDPNTTPNPNPDLYATVTFKSGDNASLEGNGTFYVLKSANKTLADIKDSAPTVKPNEGFKFVKWNPELDANTKITNDLEVNADVQKMEQSAKPVIETPTEGDTKVTIKANSGTLTVNVGGQPVPAEKIVDNKDGSYTLTLDQPLNKDQKIYAVLTEKDKTPSEKAETTVIAKIIDVADPVNPGQKPSENHFLAVFDAKDGKFDDGKQKKAFWVHKDTKLSELKDKVQDPKSNIDTKEFDKWTQDTKDFAFDETTFGTSDRNVEATYKDKEQSAKPEIKQPAANDKTIFVNVPAGTSKGKMTVTVTPKDGSEAYTIDLNTTDNVHYDGQVPAGKTLKTGDKVDATFTEDGKNPTNADPKTVESHLTDKEVIPYEPSDPKNPTDDNDPKIPNQDENGKIVEKGLYNIIGFKTEDRAKGTLTLAELIDKESISVLVKKGLTWEKVTVPTPKAKENNVFWMWSPLIPEKTANVENGNVYEAKFLTNGQEVEKDATLPDGVFKVTVSKDQASIKDNDLFGKTYAVFKDTKLSQDKFPALEANDGFKDPKWNEENPWDKVITSETEFKASATNAKFDNNNVVEVVIKEQPTLSYNEGNKLDLSKLVVTLKDKDGNTQDVPFDKFNDYGLTTNPVDKADLTVQDHNNKPVVVTHANSNKTANTENLAVKPNSTENVIPYNPTDPKNPTDDNDNNIPKVDKDGKNIVRSEYIVVAFNVTPENSGTLTLGDVKEQSVISALVKKDTKWSDVKLPETKASEGYAFWYWSDAKGETVADKEVRTARFIKSGDEITPADKDRKLPENFYKLSINKGEGIADDAKFGKVYAVKANDKLPENIFPEIKVSDEKEYRNPRWTDKDDTRFNSLDEIKAIPMSPADLEYIAKADKIQKQDWTDIVGFDKDSISEISIKEQPKLTYKDGENLDLTDLVVTLKDKNGMEVYVPFKDFKEYEITTDKVDGESLSHKDDNDKPVKVSVSDKSANTNPLVIEQKDMDKYEPKVTPIVKPNGEPTTEDEVKKAVEVPNYPKDSEEQPKILIDPDQKLPDGKTAGTFNINVTVKYPDGTEDHVEVPVIVNDPTKKENEIYEPKVTPIVKPNGEPTTNDDVKNAVEVPGYPKDAEKQPEISVDPGQKLPNGKTAGTFNIDVTVKYPDGSEDHVKVPVTVKEPVKKENEIYEPKVTPIVKPNGESTTNDDVKNAVEVPGYPKDAEKQPEISVDPGQKLPDGKTAGRFNIDVTVKYPDGSEDHVKVPVTVKEKVTPTDPIIITVTPGVEFITPEVLDPSNCAVKPWLVVKKDKGITYIVTLEDGTEVKPDKDGVYRYEYGQIVKVKAIAKDGYKFSADAVTEWSYRAPKPAVCEMKDEKPQVDNKPNGQNPNTSDSGVKVSVLAFAMSMVALFAIRKKRKENM
ncbi:Rib/alpha-like domain-containing protein [Helcococcus ovis]|uniref:Rib/alpha-like domain-containing protein n=1 Tax=Helcococcus ovis TaxID=72026 RepID=UPI003916D882